MAGYLRLWREEAQSAGDHGCIRSEMVENEGRVQLQERKDVVVLPVGYLTLFLFFWCRFFTVESSHASATKVPPAHARGALVDRSQRYVQGNEGGAADLVEPCASRHFLPLRHKPMNTPGRK